MHELLDIYIKLIVAIISFIAPLLIHLLSVFSAGVAVKQRRWEEYENQSNRLVREEINVPGANVSQLIKQNSDDFQKRKLENDKQLALLDPKQQIRAIFPTFFYSLVLIMLTRVLCDNTTYHILKTLPKWCEYTHTIILLALYLGSFIFAVKGVYGLKNVVWAIIDVKQEIAKEEEKEKQQQKEEKVTTTVEKEKR